MPLDLKGTVSLDGSGFESGLRGIEHGAERVTDALKGLALSAFGIYGIEQAISKTIETAKTLLETANRLGLAPEKFQELTFAARQSGLEIAELTTFIDKLNKNRVDPKMLPHFQKLGIEQPSVGDVGDLVMKLSLAARAQSAQITSGPLQQVGGRGAAAAIDFLNENLEELAKKAHEVGAIIKTDDLVELKHVSDEMEILSTVMVSQLAPALVFVINTIIRFVNGLQATGTFWGKMFGPGWFDEFKEMFMRGAKQDANGRTAFMRRFIESGASSETTLEELDDQSESRMKALQEEQRRREERNKIHPNEDIGDDSKIKKSHKETGAQATSDSLLRVGNFLGSAGNPMISIAHTHTHLLRQIAHNTSRKSHGGQEPGSLTFTWDEHGLARLPHL
jgi:hypothetical protein